MALNPGDANASTGMSKLIFDQMDLQMKDAIPPASLEDVRKSWRKLAYAIAAGIIQHLTGSMEIGGIQTSGSISVNVTGAVSGTSVTGTGSGTAALNQSGVTTGHVS